MTYASFKTVVAHIAYGHTAWLRAGAPAMLSPPTKMVAMMQEREAEAKHHEMEAARREAAEKAREYEGARAEVLATHHSCLCWLR